MAFQKVWKLYILLLLVATPGCNHLFYQPEKIDQSTTRQDHPLQTEILLNSSNGVKLHTIIQGPTKKPSKAILVHFHGNAQHVLAHFPFVSWFKSYQIEVITFDYRGYGKSTGEPSPSGVIDDAHTVLNFAHRKATEKKIPLIILAQSLGGAIAQRSLDTFAHKDQVDFLVIDSSFRDYKKVAFQALTKSWVTFLFSPIAYLLISNSEAPKNNNEKISIPTLVIHDKNDGVVNFDNGLDIYNNSLSGKKWLWDIESIGHIQVFSPFSNHYYRKELIKLFNKELRLQIKEI